MGYRLVSFDFKTQENEQIETIVKVPKEPRSVIHGIVKDYKDRIIQDAVVKLFELPDPSHPCKLIPLTHTFTDECGQFLFGPLTPCKHYVIKVWIDDVKIRQLIIPPYDDNDDCFCDDIDLEEEE